MFLKSEISRQSSRFITVDILVIIIVSSIVSNVIAINWCCCNGQNKKINLYEILDMAEDISTRNPNSRIYALGQSLAWVVKALEIMESLRRTQNTFHYIPFSYNFVANSPKPDFYFFKSEKFPSERKQSNYKKILKGLGLHPKQILSQYETLNRQTVIVDYVESGCGVASFVYFLLKWAKEEGVSLNDALRIVVVMNEWSRRVEFLDLNSEFRVNCAVVRRDERLLNRLVTLEDDDPDFGRLVPYYSCYDWNVPVPELDEDTKQRNNKMEKILEDYMKEELYIGTVTTTTVPTLRLRDFNISVIDVEMPSTSLGYYGYVTSMPLPM